jgi:HPr kinase/phosphorylase
VRFHATCVVIGEAGVLIRGPSGGGKSSLARALLEGAGVRGLFARLVSDDRTEIEVANGRVIARAVSPIEGRIEVRGVGIVEWPHETAAVVRLLVECGRGPPERMPHESEISSGLGNVVLPSLVYSREPGFTDIVLWRLRGLRDTGVTA